MYDKICHSTCLIVDNYKYFIFLNGLLAASLIEKNRAGFRPGVFMPVSL